MTHGHRFYFALFVLAASSPALAQEPVEFRRGDVNADGRVDLADATALKHWIAYGAPPPPCEKAGDVNDDGRITTDRIDFDETTYVDFPTVDLLLLLDHFYLGTPLPSSLTACGADQTADGLTCSSYPPPCDAPSSPPEDPRFEYRFSEAVPDPENPDGLVSTSVELCTNEAVEAWSVSFELLGESCRMNRVRIVNTVAAFPFNGGLRDPEGNFANIAIAAPENNNGRWGGVSAVLLSLSRIVTIPPGGGTGEDCAAPATILRIFVEGLEAVDPGDCGPCRLELEDGLRASGEPVDNLVVVEGESFRPLLGEGLSLDLCNRPPILFRLEDTSGSPGEEVTVPFTIRTDRPSSGFSYSIDFDEDVLEGLGTHKLWQLSGGPPYEFERFEINNDDGFLLGAAIISLSDTAEVIPPSEDVELVEFELLIRQNAPVGLTGLSFADGGVGSGGAVNNKLIAGGREITPTTGTSFVFVGARISILPDASPFSRGDANGDGQANITDVIGTLNYLFLGAARPWCFDAADMDDDGFLVITDPVYLLNFLFLGGPALPPPNARTGPGHDPTADALGCRLDLTGRV